MKIDPNNPILKQLYESGTGPRTPGDVRFGDLLGKVLNAPDPEKATVSELKLTQSLSGIQLKASLTAEPGEVTEKMEGLLDLLDSYREMLSDPRATLRDMAPVVERIAAARDQLAESLEGIESGDGLRDLVNQALVTASTEIVKFQKGDYIDA